MAHWHTLKKINKKKKSNRKIITKELLGYSKHFVHLLELFNASILLHDKILLASKVQIITRLPGSPFTVLWNTFYMGGNTWYISSAFISNIILLKKKYCRPLTNSSCLAKWSFFWLSSFCFRTSGAFAVIG